MFAHVCTDIFFLATHDKKNLFSHRNDDLHAPICSFSTFKRDFLVSLVTNEICKTVAKADLMLEQKLNLIIPLSDKE